MIKSKSSLWLSLLAAVSLSACAESNENPGEPIEPVVEPDESFCGNNVCEIDETERSCPADCKKETCGDGKCDLHETMASCPQDCQPICGNGKCEHSGGENFETCLADCSSDLFCGDHMCLNGETPESCPTDCKKAIVCGDGSCDSGENHSTCPTDCGAVCGDSHCEPDLGENETTCFDDCGNPTETFISVCGDGICDSDENQDNCMKDCMTPDEKTTMSQLSMLEYSELPESRYTFIFDYEKAKNSQKAQVGETSSDVITRQLDEFFSFPFPSDLRTDEHGRMQISGYPIPLKDNILSIAGAVLGPIDKLIPSLVERAERERAGFSPIGAIYFRTSFGVDQKSFPEPKDTMNANSCFQLINVEPESPYYHERVPLHITYHRAASKVWAPNTLVMRPVPGMGANPGDRYVAIVGNCLQSNGRQFMQSNRLKYILNKVAPTEINDKMSFYVDELQKLADSGELGMKMSDIRAMTGYRTMNAANEMDQMVADLMGKGSIVTDNNGVAIGEWAETTTSGYTAKSLNAYIFRGTFKTRNYMEGSYPYTNDNEGEMRFDENGKLASVGKEEIVRYTISIPRTAMPEKGYPIAVYGHGTGGDSDTHCRYGNDEGLALINGGYIYSGNKPLSSAVPMAMIGFDASLQGLRGNGKAMTTSDLILMIMKNPVAIRESWRQTVLDMVVLYDILDRGKLILPPLPDSKDKKNVIFDPSYGMYMGHSQGSQEGGMLLGVTDKVKNAFLSAGGAGILISFSDLKPDLSAVPVVGSMLKGKSVADILGFILGLNDGDVSYDSFITNHLVQALVEPLDPLNYTRRFIKDPPKGWAAKNVAQTVALHDQDTPHNSQFAMIASIGLPIIGDVFVPSVTYPHEAMSLAGFTKSVGSSVKGNLTSRDGQKASGASMQFIYTGLDNPHFAIYHMQSARNAYINFFRSVLDNAGKADPTPVIAINGSQNGNK